MTTSKDIASFFENGTSVQFEYCYKIYPQVLKMKAEKRGKKPQELVRLDHWYQNELPKLIKARGKDAHMIYDELVQTMKWKQSRGKFYPQLSYLVKVNTPRAVMTETKKAFRKLPNLEQAITALSNLKGVGTTMASALLAAAAPAAAPFMADECLMAIPEIEGIDYTTKEYLNFVQHISTTVTRLNADAGSPIETPLWSPHRVELALWAHYVANDLSPDLLENMPGPGSSAVGTNGSAVKVLVGTGVGGAGDDTNDADDESLGAAAGREAASGETNNTATESETENENTNPPPATVAAAVVAAAATISVSADGDSNFVSNDSTSQEEQPQLQPLEPPTAAVAVIGIDDNTQTTTATTTSTDDGGDDEEEIGATDDDSQSNLEAPPQLMKLTASSNNISSNKNGGEPIATVAAANGNGTLPVATAVVAGVAGTAADKKDDGGSEDDDEEDEDDDDDEEDDDDELDDEESSNSAGAGLKSLTPIIKKDEATNATNTADQDSTLSGAGGGQKRALNCGDDGVKNEQQPDTKKIRSD